MRYDRGVRASFARARDATGAARRRDAASRSSSSAPGPRRISRAWSLRIRSLPVIGVPIDSSALKGLDALLSTVQMPPGVPVATVSIGKPGATNAGVLAAQILGARRSSDGARWAVQVKLAEKVEAAAVKLNDSDLGSGQGSRPSPPRVRDAGFGRFFQRSPGPVARIPSPNPESDL